jgi:hypothetical protein
MHSIGPGHFYLHDFQNGVSLTKYRIAYMFVLDLYSFRVHSASSVQLRSYLEENVAAPV